MSGKYPPAHAQQMPQPDQQIQLPSQMAISPYDPEFASDINAINRRLNDNDTRREALKSTVDEMHGDVREMQTNMKWYFWIIGALLSGSIVIPSLKLKFKGLGIGDAE